MPAGLGLELAREACKKMPTASSRAIGRYLYAKYPGRWTSEKTCYNCVLYVRGAQGNKGRKEMRSPEVKSALRPHVKDFALPCPPSQCEPWEPLHVTGPAVILILSDLHVPYHSPSAIEAAVAYAKEHYAVDVLLINGDLTDWYTISRHDKDPRKKNLKAEIEAVGEFVGWLRPQFKKATCIWKYGNHEERWDKYIWNNSPELADVANVQLHQILNLEKHNIEYVDGQRPIMCGNLPVFHGHELPRGMSSPVNPARGAFLRTYHTVLHGHLHRSSTHVEPDLWQSETTCWTTGCLCGLRPEYARINKWNHGFAVVEVERSGEFAVHNYRINANGTVRPA